MTLPQPDEVRIVIPSRKREQWIADRTFGLFPSALVCVEDSEAEAYAKFVPEDHILQHPVLKSYGEIYNWILANVPDETIFIPDDDIVAFHSMVGNRSVKYQDPADLLQIIINAANTTKAVGAHQWGFNMSPRPQTFNPFDPIKFTGVCRGASGVIGKELGHEPQISLLGDAEFSLKQMLKYRIVYIDTRFYVETVDFLTQAGGNTAFRSEERLAREHNYLKKIWGKYITTGNMGVTTVGGVKRRQ